MEKTIKNNIIWIDYAKFIGIILMIFQHNITQVYHLGNNLIFNSISAFILLFHMPLFFIISGFLYHNKGKIENYKKAFWSLLLPYFLYSFLYLPFIIFNKIFVYNLDLFSVIKKSLLGICFGEVVNNPVYYTVCGPCWFILVIFNIRVIINNFNFNIKSAGILAILSFILLNVLINKNSYSYFCIAPTLLAIPYFVFGYILQKQTTILKIFSFDSLLNKVANIIILVLIFVYLVFVLLYTGHTLRMPCVLELRPSIINLLMYYMCGFAGTIAVIFFSMTFKSLPNFINITSKNTLFIIFFHFVLLAFAKFFNFSKYADNQNCLFIFIILAVSTLCNLLICYYFIKFLQKRCPLLLGKYYPAKRESYNACN